MAFIETTIFTKLLNKYLNDDEYQSLQKYLMLNPKDGTIIIGSGGIRKLRWSVGNRGKSGGIRVIYYFKDKDNQIWLLTMYAKNKQASISKDILNKIKQEIDNE
jgi:mRNA-degrading endonuclease RelE of RelBE toxin-antitoxin system